MSWSAARDRVLDLLKGHQWVTTWDVIQAGGSEGTRRLRELREEGYVIEKRKLKGSNQWEYRLEGDER